MNQQQRDLVDVKILEILDKFGSAPLRHIENDLWPDLWRLKITGGKIVCNALRRLKRRGLVRIDQYPNWTLTNAARLLVDVAYVKAVWP